jgi:hypothetical protein
VSDTTEADSSNAAKYKIFLRIKSKPNQKNLWLILSSLLLKLQTACHSKNIFYHSCNIALSTFVKPNKPSQMRKVFINKWFFLAAFLTLSLSTVSFVAYKKTETVCTINKECCPNAPANTNQKTDLLWDVLSRQLTHFISIQ